MSEDTKVQSPLTVLPTVSETKGCDGCPFQKLFPKNTFVGPKHGTGSRLVVAEAPGEDEAIFGEPLVGSSGKWFDAMCRKAGIRREELTIINTVNCRPPDNVYPTDSKATHYISHADGQATIKHCMDAHVWPLVHGKQWTRIDALGNYALQELTGLDGILYWRGSPLPLKGEEKVRVLPTIHPSYISRDQTMVPVVVNDLKKNTVVPPEYYNLTPSLEDVRSFTAAEFAFDIETKWGSNAITMVGLCARNYHAMVVPFTGAYIPELKRIFANARSLFGQNHLQFDIPVLQDAGIFVSPDAASWDIMLLHHLLFPQFSGDSGDEDRDPHRKTAGGHGLEFISSQFTNKPAWKELYRGQPNYWEHRCARDCDVTLQAGRVLLAMAKAEQLEELYTTVAKPLAKICYMMQTNGIKIDPARLLKVRNDLVKEIAEQELLLPDSLKGYDKPRRIRKPAPEGTLNDKGKPVKYLYEEGSKRISPWRSSRTLAKYLYKELALPEQRHPKSKKVTTDKGAIEKCIRILRRNNRLGAVAGLQAYQKVKKAATLVSSFVKDDFIKKQIVRQHPHFNVHGTSSGRLSSTNPNFQNQPEKARYMYVPSHEGWSFLDVDYSNIEPRLTAFFANDVERLARFAKPGYNDHKFTTSIFFDIPYDEVVKDNDKDAPYGKAKRINNGLNYGMGAIKIANTFDLDVREVKDLIFKWKQLNAATAQWQEETAARAKSEGFLRTPFGRKRWFYTNSYYTESLSFLPQSTAADIIFRAMIALSTDRAGLSLEDTLKIVRVVKPLPAQWRLLLSVHDSLLFEGPSETMPEAARVIREVMEQPWPELGGFNIPVEIKMSNLSWAEGKVYNPPN